MDNTRAELIELVVRLGQAHPTQRFGQLIANLSYWAKGPTKSAIWDAEDEELIQAAHQHLEFLDNSHSKANRPASNASGESSQNVDRQLGIDDE